MMEHLYDKKFKVIYFSLEMSSEQLFTKLLSMYIFETHNRDLSYSQILSRERDYILSDEDFELVKYSMDWKKALEDNMLIYDKSLNAETLYRVMMTELEKHGTFSETEHRKTYTPYDKDTTILVVIDHLSLVRPSNGRTLKQEMDTISSYLVTLTNMCNITDLVVMQSNRDATSTERRKLGLEAMKLSDTKDSGSLTILKFVVL